MIGADRDNPYLGLDSFGEADSGYFFGRDIETGQLLRQVRRQSLTIFFGRSGLGKSSLLAAGLFPFLRAEHLWPINVRLNFECSDAELVDQIRERIAEEILRNKVEADAPVSGQSLWEYCHRTKFWSRENWLLTPVFVFDQFEEFFTLGGGSVGCPIFLETLADIAENRIPEDLRRRIERQNEELPDSYEQQPAKVIITLREDYLGDIESLQDELPSVAMSRYRLTHMSGTQALEAVYKPAEDLIDKITAVAIVRFVAGESENVAPEIDPLAGLEIEPALLSLVCRELNQRRIDEKRQRISVELLKGAREAVFVRFYERCYERVGTDVRRFVEDRLLTDNNLRTTVAVQEALHSPGVSERAIDMLVSRRLLRREERLGIPHLEIIHDVLRDVAGASRERRRALEVEREGRKSLVRYLIGGLAVGVVVLAAFLNYAYLQRQIANNQKEINLIGRLTAQSSGIKGELGALLARQAFLMAEGTIGADEVAIDQALRDVLSEPWVSRILTQSPYSSSTRIAFASDGQQLLSTRDSRLQLRILALHDEEPITVYEISASETFNALVVSRDSRFAAAVATTDAISSDEVAPPGGRVYLWRIANLQADPILLLRSDGAEVAPYTSVAFSPLDERLATMTANGSIELWNPEDPSVDPYLVGTHPANAMTIAFNSNGRLLASGGDDGQVCLWSVDIEEDANKCLANDESSEAIGSAVTALGFSPDGRTIAAGYEDGSVRLWDLSSDDSPLVLLDHKAPVTSMSFSPDGRWLATDGISIVSEADDPRIWNLEDPGDPVVLPGHESGAQSVSFHPSDGTLATADGEGVIRLWQLPSVRRSIATGTGQTQALAFTPDDDRLVVGGIGGLEEIDLTSIGARKVISEDGDIWWVAISPDGQLLAIAGGQPFSRSILQVRKLGNLQAAPVELAPHENGTYAVAFSPDGATLASVGRDSRIAFWDVATMTLGRYLEGQEVVQGYNAINFREDGNTFVTASDLGITIFDLLGSSESFTSDNTYWVVYRPGGLQLASAGQDGVARIWDAESLSVIATFRGHEGGINHLAFNPDGNILATAGLDGTVRLWRLGENQGEATILRADNSGAMSVAFDTTGERIVSGYTNRVVIWPAGASTLAQMVCVHVSGNLTIDEWDQFVGPDVPHEETCPGLPERRPVVQPMRTR